MLAVCVVCCVSFILMMYTDIHSVLFQFAFNQWRFIVIHGLCCRSQSNPGFGSRRLTADRVVNYRLCWRCKITHGAHKFSAQQFKGQHTAKCSSASPPQSSSPCLLIKQNACCQNRLFCTSSPGPQSRNFLHWWSATGARKLENSVEGTRNSQQ